MVHNWMRRVVLFACLSLAVTGLAWGDIPNRIIIPKGPEPAGLTTTATIAAGIALSLGAVSLIFLIRNRRQKP